MIDYALMVSYSIALSQILNVAHNIDHIEYVWVNNERIRIDYGTPRYEETNGNVCGFANYQYQPLIFLNTRCNTTQILKHEVTHIKQYQWYYHPNFNETRKPYETYRMQFEIEAYKSMEE